MTSARLASPRTFRRGFSLVELLIVITILGILMSLMTAAMQASREAARKLQCKNNLKQLGLAVTHHLDSFGYFPSSGWGWRWAGDPDRGFGLSQPGGWIYSVLPFIEEKPLWSIGRGIDFATNPTAKKTALAAQVNKPIPFLYCAARRDALTYPYTSISPINLNRSDLAAGVLKTDYAINVGDSFPKDSTGPPSLAVVNSGKYKWLKTTGFTGVSFQRSQITAAQVLDGFTHTYLIGEKYLNPVHYADGVDIGDNECATDGFDIDMCRAAGPNNEPMWDTSGVVQTYIFGSAHAEGFHMVFCDGSVHLIDYRIDPYVDGNLANRADGQSIPSDSVH